MTRVASLVIAIVLMVASLDFNAQPSAWPDFSL
jgi:hypothetical protein